MPGITQKVDTQESPALHTCLLKHSSFPTHNIVMMHEFCLKLGPTLHPTNCYRPRFAFTAVVLHSKHKMPISM